MRYVKFLCNFNFNIFFTLLNSVYPSCSSLLLFLFSGSAFCFLSFSAIHSALLLSMQSSLLRNFSCLSCICSFSFCTLSLFPYLVLIISSWIILKNEAVKLDEMQQCRGQVQTLKLESKKISEVNGFWISNDRRGRTGCIAHSMTKSDNVMQLWKKQTSKFNSRVFQEKYL